MNKIEFAVRQLIPLLEKAGVLSVYIASTPEHRKLCSAEQILISNLFEQLVDFTKENDMDMQEIIEKTIRDIVAEQFENNDKLQERLAKLESIVDELNATAYSHIKRFETLEQRTMGHNLSVRLISLEESVHNCVTRKEARDVAYETVRDADLDELLGSYVKDKVEEVLDDDEFGDRMNSLITSILDETEFAVKVV